MSSHTKHLLLAVLVVIVSAINVTAGTGAALKPNQRVSLKLGETRAEIMTGIVTGFRNDTLQVCSRGEIRIDGIVTNDSVAFDFPATGATYDGATKIVTGTIENGDLVTLPLTEISHAKVRLLLKDELVPMTFSAHMLHTRLRHKVRYPQLIWEGSVDSIYSIKVWRRTNETGILLSGLIGLSLGLICSADAEEPELNYPSREATIAINAGLGLCAGLAVGVLVFKGHWAEIPLDRLKVAVRSTTRNGLGLSFAIGL